MIDSRFAIGRQFLRYAMAGIAACSLCAAVFAAPLTATPKARLGGQGRANNAKLAFAPLAAGPAFQLGRSGPGEDEDCVRVTRITGPDGRVYVTRGLICQE